MRLRLITPLALLTASAFAAAPGQPAPRSAVLDTVSVLYSVTADADLKHAPGELGVQRFEFETGGRTVLGPGNILLHGLAWTRTDVDRPATALLPDSLDELALRLGWMYQIDPQWRLTATVRPGFYGDRAKADSDTFNAPFLGLASYAASRELIWSFGLIANSFSDNPVLPVVGVRWTFAPDWTFNLGFPRAGVSWKYSSTATFSAGATFQGGGYKLTRHPSAPAAALTRTLVNEKLDYREIRVGLGADLALSESVTLGLDAGMTVSQRFEYEDRGIVYRAKPAPFVALSVSGSF
jgi:hypothetical protein